MVLEQGSKIKFPMRFSLNHCKLILKKSNKFYLLHNLFQKLKNNMNDEKIDSQRGNLN